MIVTRGGKKFIVPKDNARRPRKARLAEVDAIEVLGEPVGEEVWELSDHDLAALEVELKMASDPMLPSNRNLLTPG